MSEGGKDLAKMIVLFIELLNASLLKFVEVNTQVVTEIGLEV